MESIDKKEISKVFQHIAVLMELKGENPFKSRAYENGARAVEGFEGNIEELVEQANAGNIKGIGKALAEKIEEVVRTERLEFLEELENSIPEGLLEMLRIQGLGPKKVKRLYDELGISSLGELEYACQENRLAALKGFGKKSQANILEGIENLKKHAGRFHYHLVEREAKALVARLRANAAVESIQVCGSLRRGKETVKDIDILAVSSYPEGLMQTFVEDSEVERITGHGPTKSSVILRSGVASDLRVVAKKNLPAALVYFTGSMEHNTTLRGLAKKSGMKLNEYALEKNGKPLDIVDEAGIYQALGLSYIPPEIRENMGEIEASAEGALPTLVEASDILGVLHTHTTFSDGTDTVEGLASGCKDLGYAYLGISDHSRSAFYAGGLSVEDLEKQRKQIDAWNAKNPDFRVFAGIESDILADGRLDYEDDVLAKLDFVIASVHSGFTGSKEETTARIIKALEHPATRILGHPTGRLLLGREGYKVDMDKIIDACAANNVVIELNANPYRLDIDWRLIRSALKKGCRIAVNPDAHSVKQVRYIEIGVKIARKGWCEKKDILNTLTADQFAAFCKEGK